MMVVYNMAYYACGDTVRIKITDKERINTNDEDKDSKYLIFAEGETFENTDLIFAWKWNSSDVQGMLKKDSTYTVKVVGFRVPFFSMYRNIVKVVY